MKILLARPLLAAFLALGLAACSSPLKFRDEAPVETRTPTPVQADAAAPVGATTEAPVAKGEVAERADAPPTPRSEIATVSVNPVAGSAAATAGGWPAQRVVYFDFDSFALREDSKGTIEGHARMLMADKSRRLLVEGHTDERGGREYNLALGQKRAEAVLKSLTLLGVAEQQLEAVSMGKEKPAAEGHDEEAWARNRRAELKERR